jgi:glycosyltransferase involved in cell wall biosynthesis
MSEGRPRLSFGIIVLNGEPFTRYCLRALYPFAHEIIVVEGACRAAAGVAGEDGHSTDGTQQALRRFKAEEDPLDKVRIVTRQGFWSEKEEQSRAYAELATGDYLWQVDIDEFYQPEDMQYVWKLLGENPDITAVSFRQITFWGGFDYTTDGWYLRSGADIYHRIFRWRAGFRYQTHRPPTVLDDTGANLRDRRWVKGEALAKKGIRLYHYSLLFPKNVSDKCHYYARASWAGHARLAQEWAERVFFRLENPFRVHNVYAYPSWLERFRGPHPPEVKRMISDIRSGALHVDLRQTEDIESLLEGRKYRLGRAFLKLGGFLFSPRNPAGRRAGRVVLRHWNRAVSGGFRA